MKQTLVAALLMGYVIAFAGCNGNPPQEVPDAELVGTVWMLQSIEDQGTTIKIESNKVYSIHLSEDNNFAGTADCNEYFGTYNISNEDSLDLVPLGITYKGCGESIHEYYYYSLQFIHSYQINNNILRLYYDENNSVLNYIKGI